MTVAIQCTTFTCGCRLEENLSDPERVVGDGQCPKHGPGCHTHFAVTVMAEGWPLPEPEVPRWARFRG